MAALTINEPQIRVSHDSMKAYLYLPGPELESYTVSDVTEALQASGVVYGIQEDKIQEAIDKQIYNEEVLIAEGDKPEDGVAGYYEYKFDMNFSKQPKVHPDGSVDYWSIKMVEIVTEGQEIAVYHPAVPGVDGMDVKGKPLLAKRGRDLVPLRGKGFERSEDGLT